MIERGPPPDEQPLRRQKTRDRALVLPLVGLVLLLPPLAGIFELDVRMAGLPLMAVYLFGVWALLILGAALLASELRAGMEAASGPDAGQDGSRVDDAPR